MRPTGTSRARIMSDVAARAGVSKPSVYAHGGTKDELFAACLAREAERLLTTMTAAVSPGSGPDDPGPKARLRRALKAEQIVRVAAVGLPVDPERMIVVEVIDDGKPELKVWMGGLNGTSGPVSTKADGWEGLDEPGGLYGGSST